MTAVHSLSDLKRQRSAGGRRGGRGQRGGASGSRGRGGRGQSKTSRAAPADGTGPSTFAGQAYSLGRPALGKSDIRSYSKSNSALTATNQPLSYTKYIQRLQEDHEDLAALDTVEAARAPPQGGQQGQQAQGERRPTTTGHDGGQNHLEGASSGGGGCSLNRKRRKPGAPDGCQADEGRDCIDLCSSDSDDNARRKSSDGARASQPSAASCSASASLRLAAGQSSRQRQAQSRGFSGSSNPLMDPPRYIPPGGEEAADVNLSVRERVLVADAGLHWQQASAILDTGNSGHTMLTKRLAGGLGLLGGLGATRTVTVRGVVAGAQERVPLVPLRYKIKGRELRVMAAVTEADLGCDVLVSVHDIQVMECDGYRLSTKR